MKTLQILALNCLLAATGFAQTTTWHAAENPHVISGTYTVPAGQTLILEPGVQVNISANSTLQVEGELIGQGTAANRITITGAVNYSSKLIVAGKSTLTFTDVKTQTVPERNGVLLFADCRFTGNGTIFNGQVQQPDGSRSSYIQIDRSAFIGDGTSDSASLYVAYCTVVVRDTSFTNASYLDAWPAYLFLDNVTSDHSTVQQFGLAIGSDSDLYLNNVSVTNATHAGLMLAGDTRNGTNVLIGPNVTLQGNEYPIHLTIAGLYPASNVPATGNVNNAIHLSEFAGSGGFWPKFSIPYYLDGSPLSVNALLWISPGVTVNMSQSGYINDVGFGDGMRAFGTKEEPITFKRADPSQAWYSLHADRTEGGRLRHVIVEGSTAGVNGGIWRLENCVFRNNDVGTNGNAIVSGSQYLNNGYGHFTSGFHNAPQNPNSFEGNTVGVNFSNDARNAWWGSPTGPTTPRNPGGTGDRIENQQTQFEPFLTTRPDYTDAPPEVRMMKPSEEQLPGSKVTLRWDSKDDVGIVSQKVLFSAVGNYVGSFIEVATLPGNQRTYEWTVPDIGFQNAGPTAYIKVVAIDTTGKESFDEWPIVLPTNNIQGDVTFNFAPGQTFEPGEILVATDTPNIEPYMTRLKGNVEIIGATNRTMYGTGMPFVSTDTARYVVAYGDTSNHQKIWYSPFFKIRPKNLLGDAAPTINMMNPQPGQSYAPGTVIPINWTANDDEGLRAFDIVASFNGGRTWQPIVRDLPGDARSYNWQTAPGTGSADVRVMVIAKDWRFQTSSDGANRAFATNSGSVSPTPSPTATPTPFPTATATPVPTASPSPSATVTPSATASPSATATPIATASPIAATQPLNIATRGRVEAGDNAMIGGFIITGNSPKKVVVRAIGPSLQGLLAGALTDPILELRGPDGALLSRNDNWRDDASQASYLETNNLAPSHNLESAIVMTLSPGNYTAAVAGKNGVAGVGLVEVYDVNQAADSKLANLSTRGVVQSAENVLIGGFILGGSSANTKVLVRAIGPSLANFGVNNAVSDPTLELRDSNGELIRSNDNWKDDQATQIEATGLSPAMDSESVVIADLPAGAYTAIVASKGSNGVGLVEIYNLP